MAVVSLESDQTFVTQITIVARLDNLYLNYTTVSFTVVKMVPFKLFWRARLMFSKSYCFIVVPSVTFTSLTVVKKLNANHNIYKIIELEPRTYRETQ